MGTLKKNLCFNVLLSISNYIFPLITFPYVTRILGAEGIGIANFILSIVDYTILFANLGITTIGIKEIAACIDKKDTTSDIFSKLVSIHIVVTIFVLLIYFICVIFVADFHDQQTLMLVGSVKIVSNIFLVEWFFQGLQSFKYITLRSIGTRVLYVILVLSLVKQRDDYDIYIAVTIFQVLLNATINWSYTKRIVTFRFTLLGFKEYFSSILIWGTTIILFSFYGTFNIIFLGFSCSKESVGYYTTATRLYALIIAVITAYNGVFVPYLNNLFSQNRLAEFKIMVTKSLNVVCFLAIPIIFGCVVLAPDIITVIAGDGFVRAILPFQIIIIQVLLVGISQITENQVLLAYGKNKIVLYVTLTTTMMAAIIIFLFVPVYAELASAYAVALPHVIECVLLVYFARRCICFDFPYKSILLNILSSIPIIFICLFFQYSFHGIYIRLIMSIVCSVLAYWSIEYFIVRNEFIVGKTRRLFNKLKL